MTATSDWLLSESLAPVVSSDPLEPLYAGAVRGVLVLPFCADCSLALDLEQHGCDGCGSLRIDWRETARTGVVHSSTTMHRLEPGLVTASGPYPIVDVELADGHRLIMTTVDPAQRAPQIGDTVAVAFRNLAGVAIPAAQPINSTDTEDTNDNH
ncbi:Zn-ribbon domain-containing OB-fold protein [Gordonia hydrophobica]|uniref:OB-fold domain-containing protein n=1 Tax=Gordonia hydrophobica TaxID=40516 RepID=A0ABZ2TZR3_9ACTN|nr:OB-fold domain-containing protein [Gordonia hydrophobica]MBM7369200.1 putative OB-fold protein [Gordonia hydrophobica]